jgi:PAS domain S-box-containing protein
MDTVPGEARAFRRTMRDLVALSALPGVWAGYQPRQVADGLAEVLLATLRLDLVYLRLPGQTNGPEIEVAHTAGGAAPTDQARGIGRALAPWLDGAGTDPAPTVPNPVGPGAVRVVVVPIGYGQQGGVLVAGSRQEAFPSDEDRLFLTVGANQTAAVFQRLHAEAALRESEERFRSLVQNSWDVITLLDAECTILYQSPSVERLLGYRPQDRIGRNVFRDSIVHPEDMAAQRAFYDAIRGRPGSPFTAEFRLRHGDGSWRHIEAVGQNFLDDPSVAGIVVNYRDVTERKRAEEALRESHSLLSAVTEGTPDAVFVKDTRGRYILINTAGAGLAGRCPEEVLGKDDTALFEPETARAFMEADRRVLEGGRGGHVRRHPHRRGHYPGLCDHQGGVPGLAGQAPRRLRHRPGHHRAQASGRSPPRE